MKSKNLLQIAIEDRDLIKKLIPHREPMIMVDGLHHYSEKEAIASLTVREDNLFIADGMFSESGLIEHMAQTAALHAGYKFYTKNESAREGFIASIKKFELKEHLPKLNNTIESEVNILYEAAGMTSMRIIAQINNRIIAIAEMTTVLKDNH
ncbi:hypothetical protein [Winogradskyella sp. A3E31]|uniref:hypothetical protein n=1 Tax=Winogradskyella sp. A3E31 TaxID=3349637 RepID=UPI00398B991F